MRRLSEPTPRSLAQRRAWVRMLACAPLIAAFAARVRPVRAAEAQPGPERATLLRDHPLVGQVWDARARRFVSRQALLETLSRASLRLLGEVHDNPDHHALQVELIDAIAARGLQPLVAFEQMDSEHDAALQQRLGRGGVTAEDVAEAVGFDRKGWNWVLYEPLVATALRHRLPMRAANLSRPAGAQIARSGSGAIDPERARALRIDAWTPEREAVLREIVRIGHCGALPESVVPNMAAAQRVRDATLAQALLGASGDGAILIAGNGHVRRDVGVPVYLEAAGRTSCAVGILEVEAERHDPQAYVRASTRGPIYDFACFTARRERPDPCAAFRK